MKQKKIRNIITIIFLIILLISSTYAWFTVNKIVSVENISINVKSLGSIEVSVNAIDWKASVNKEELLEHKKYLSAVNQIPEYSLPVSTVGEIENGKMKLFSGKVKPNTDGNYELYTSRVKENNGTEGDYIAFDLFFKVLRDTTLYLDSSSVFDSENVDDNSVSTGIENALRVAILDYGSMPLGANPEQIQNMSNVVDAKIIEPNSDVHTIGGVYSARNIYGIENIVVGRENQNLKYYGVNNEITSGVTLKSNDTNFFTEVNSISLKRSFFETDDTCEILKMSAGIRKIRVYVWIEGQDVDCENYASGASIKFTLNFTSEK